MVDGEHEQCWICLDDASEDGSRRLVSPCKCPRRVHPPCLARWQLQQAGRHEEKFCRFCNTTLADWKANLTPKDLAPEVSKVQPIMVVYFEGQIHRIPVKQGPDGLDEFQSQIRELFRLPEDVDISLTFGCKEPMSGQHLKLEGIGAFDAAVHCASVAAADRQQKIKRSQSASDVAAAAAAGGGRMGRSTSSHQLMGAGAEAGGERARRQPAGAERPAGAAPAAAAAAAAAELPPREQRRGMGRSRSFHARTPSAGSAAAAAAAAEAGTLLPPPPQQPATPPQQLPAAFRSVFSAVAADAAAAPAAAPAPAGSPSPRPRPASALARARGGLKHERFSFRNLTELGDVPEADETVAVGSVAPSDSVGGKLKLTLRAFSRKVARSLSFAQRGPGGAACGADGGAGPSGSRGGTPPPAGSRSPSPAPPAVAAASPRARAGLGGGAFSISAAAATVASPLAPAP
ncbi:hypothetical protein Rsub_11747 [Raphidocelis subcapitata]|uniref:RING-CH-type domain-containing protein n=1 Tax=Raphidocelis subcapitata TaxID=307507 RepID=A0A2V0PQ62_9CHLO|nr:hypothetical protein Rsub_11747 [Raphidocelis subcapitata]|eukprot:GBF99335.1 hypothetical protein Rsub_11747 [Raphidocelis subcapitata]